MTAASKRQGVGNKTQPKRPLCKQVLAAPVTTQWPSITEAQTRRVKQAIQEAASGLKDKKRIQPPWRELRKVPKDQRAKAIEKFKEQHLASLELSEREAYLQMEQTRKAKLTEVVFGYNEIMRHLSKGTLAAVLVNKSATPEFLAKSFLPGCYCRSIPVVAIENLQEVFGKCIAVGFKESVKEKSSAFYPMYALMKDGKSDSTQIPQPSTTSPSLNESNTGSKPHRNNSKSFKRVKIPPPVVNASSFHLIRGSPEQTAFLSKLNAKQWSSDVISLSSDIPSNEKVSTSFDFRKKKQFTKSDRKVSSPILGEKEIKECQKSSTATIILEDVIFELDYGGENDNKTDDELASVEAGRDTTEEKVIESPLLKSSIEQKSDASSEVQSDEQLSKSTKRKAREVEEKLTGVASYVPAAITRVVGNPKRKKHKSK